MVFEGDSLKDYILDFKDNKLVRVELPNVEERKVGKWILIDEEKNIWKCTKCIELGKDDWWKLNSGTPQDNKMDYCPHCGAKMIGESNNG